MTDNVTTLPGVSLGVEPDTKTIELLEEALERAKSGKLQGVAIVMVERNPDVFETMYTASGAGHTLAAGVMSLQHQIGRLLSETDLDR